MSVFPITRIEGGGYFTDIDAWGRAVASNLPPPHILHLELERQNQQVDLLESDKEDLLDANNVLRRKVVELRARLRTEIPASVNRTNTSLYEKIDRVIGTADINQLRAVLREVCRESETAAIIAAGILPSRPGPQVEHSAPTRAPSTTRTTSTRRTSVRFQEPPIAASTRSASVGAQEEPTTTPADRPRAQAEQHERTRSRRGRGTEADQQSEVDEPEFTTPRRSKRRSEDAAEEEQESRKRKSTTLLTCMRCKKEYDPVKNDTGYYCRAHRGHTRVLNDSDIWRDFDEEVQGWRENYSEDPEYAEGFIWTCCGKYSNVNTCASSKHLSREEQKAKTKRPRT